MWTPSPNVSVLGVSIEIDTYQSQFKRALQEEFPTGSGGSQIRQRHVDNDQDPEVSTTNELFALANGPSWTPISVNSCVVDGVSREAFKDDQYILVTQVKQVFYLEDKTKPHWKVVKHVNHKKFSDDGCQRMSSADVARSHGGDGGGDDRPPSHVVPTGCGGCFANKGKGPVSINFDVGDKQTLNPLGPHAAHWSNYIGEVVRSVPLYYPSWEKVPKERKAAIISNIGAAQEILTADKIYEGINMHLQKSYNTNKASFKAKHWKADPTAESYDVEAIRRARPEEITAAEGKPQTLRSTFHSLSPSGEHTLLTGYSLRMRTAAYINDSKYSDMFKEFESGGASGSGGCGDDEESGDDEDDDDDGER
ncbi:hypothetical protein Tco_1483524 [Tanacetum coccineum]